LVVISGASGKLYRWEFERAGQAMTLDLTGSVVFDEEQLMVDAAITGSASPMSQARRQKQPYGMADHAGTCRDGRRPRNISGYVTPDISPFLRHCVPSSMS
jgi:hypothetical protein